VSSRTKSKPPVLVPLLPTRAEVKRPEATGGGRREAKTDARESWNDPGRREEGHEVGTDRHQEL
jgi:hypothetical protein